MLDICHNLSAWSPIYLNLLNIIVLSQAPMTLISLLFKVTIYSPRARGVAGSTYSKLWPMFSSQFEYADNDFGCYTGHTMVGISCCGLSKWTSLASTWLYENSVRWTCTLHLKSARTDILWLYGGHKRNFDQIYKF